MAIDLPTHLDRNAPWLAESVRSGSALPAADDGMGASIQALAAFEKTNRSHPVDEKLLAPARNDLVFKIIKRRIQDASRNAVSEPGIDRLAYESWKASKDLSWTANLQEAWNASEKTGVDRFQSAKDAFNNIAGHPDVDWKGYLYAGLAYVAELIRPGITENFTRLAAADIATGTVKGLAASGMPTAQTVQMAHMIESAVLTEAKLGENSGQVAAYARATQEKAKLTGERKLEAAAADKPTEEIGKLREGIDREIVQVRLTDLPPSTAIGRSAMTAAVAGGAQPYLDDKAFNLLAGREAGAERAKADPKMTAGEIAWDKRFHGVAAWGIAKGHTLAGNRPDATLIAAYADDMRARLGRHEPFAGYDATKLADKTIRMAREQLSNLEAKSILQKLAEKRDQTVSTALKAKLEKASTGSPSDASGIWIAEAKPLVESLGNPALDVPKSVAEARQFYTVAELEYRQTLVGNGQVASGTIMSAASIADPTTAPILKSMNRWNPFSQVLDKLWGNTPEKIAAAGQANNPNLPAGSQAETTAAEQTRLTEAIAASKKSGEPAASTLSRVAIDSSASLQRMEAEAMASLDRLTERYGKPLMPSVAGVPLAKSLTGQHGQDAVPTKPLATPPVDNGQQQGVAASPMS